MANQADITIKKTDGVTNIVYKGIAGSGGDNQPALWRSETSATYRGNRDQVSLTFKPNGAKTAKRATVKGVMPVARTVSGVEVVADRVVGEFTILVPDALTDAEVNEKVDQLINMIASTEFRSAIKAGANYS